MLFLLGITGSPVPEKDPEKRQDIYEPEQLSLNNSAPNFPTAPPRLAVTQQPSEEYPNTASPTDITPASEKTDLNTKTTTTTTPLITEPKSTDAYDNPEIAASKSTAKNPQSVIELEELSHNASVPTVPPEMSSTRINSTPTSDQSTTTNSQSTSEPKSTPSATAQANNLDLKPSNPFQSEDRQDPEVNLDKQTEAQLEPSENKTLERLEIQKIVSTDSPTYPALIESTHASAVVSLSPTKVQEKPTKPKDANNNLQDLQDYQAGKDTTFTLLLLNIYCANNDAFIY